MRSIAFVDFGYLKRACEGHLHKKRSSKNGQPQQRQFYSFAPEAMIDWLEGERYPPMRAYWYYSRLPERHQSSAKQQSFFRAVGSESKVQLRLGTLRQDKSKSHSSWLEQCVKASGGDIEAFNAKYQRREATFHQKGVDTLLSLDMYRMAMNDAYDVAYLVTGDQDMVHAVNLVQFMGKSVVLHVVNRSALSTELAMAVDDVNQIDDDHVRRMFKKADRQPIDDVEIVTDDHI